jgi:hypothetical protein
LGGRESGGESTSGNSVNSVLIAGGRSVSWCSCVTATLNNQRSEGKDLGRIGKNWGRRKGAGRMNTQDSRERKLSIDSVVIIVVASLSSRVPSYTGHGPV